MQTTSCASLDLLSVLSDDVHERLSNNAVSCDEEVNVLSASAVEELVVDCSDCAVSIT